MNLSASMELYERCTSLPTVGEQLLPGIPNEITLDCITPKLSWRVFHVLSLVNHVWSDAVRTRQVYNPRIRVHSTERLVLVTHIRIGKSRNGIALYSAKDKFCFPLLPPIPDLLEGIPKFSESVSLDGKVYVLGGLVEGTLSASHKVYVLDLVGQRQWKECAGMKEARVCFGCGVLHGKIYVFGGITGLKPCDQPGCESEVYDPKENVWSPIRGMSAWRFSHGVKSVGEELFLHSGVIGHRVNLTWRAVMSQAARHDAHSIEVYHPVKDKWRTENSFGCHQWGVLFVARGKLHSMTKDGIHVQNVEENSWTCLHSISPLFHPVIGSTYNVSDGGIGSPLPLLIGRHGSSEVTLVFVQEVRDELLAIVHCNKSEGQDSSTCLVQSRGFGGKTRELMWEEVQSTFFSASQYSSLVPIEL